MSSITVSTGTTLSQDYFMRTFYDNNTSSYKTSSRKSIANTQLTYNDITALHRAARRLSNFDYDREAAEDDDGNTSITNAIQAFADVYNNTISSGSKSSDTDLNRYIKQLKKITKANEDDLENMGIDINEDGTLEVKTSMLLSVDQDKIKTAFSTEESSYLKDILKIAKRFENKNSQLLYTSTTGNGGSINTTA